MSLKDWRGSKIKETIGQCYSGMRKGGNNFMKKTMKYIKFNNRTTIEPCKIHDKQSKCLMDI